MFDRPCRSNAHLLIINSTLYNDDADDADTVNIFNIDATSLTATLRRWFIKGLIKSIEIFSISIDKLENIMIHLVDVRSISWSCSMLCKKDSTANKTSKVKKSLAISLDDSGNNIDMASDLDIRVSIWYSKSNSRITFHILTVLGRSKYQVHYQHGCQSWHHLLR